MDVARQMAEHLNLANRLVKEALEKSRSKGQEEFNQKQVRIDFEVDELVRFWNRVPARKGQGPSKLKLRNGKFRVVDRRGTIYNLKNVVTGKEKRAHVTQIARMRALGDDKETAKEPPQNVNVNANEGEVPTTVTERMWDRLRVGSFAIIHLKEDKLSVLRLVEIISADAAAGEFGGWYWIHSILSDKYNAERPLNQWISRPEYRKPGGDSGYIVSDKEKHKFERVTDTFSSEDTELVQVGFNLESNGKVNTQYKAAPVP